MVEDWRIAQLVDKYEKRANNVASCDRVIKVSFKVSLMFNSDLVLGGILVRKLACQTTITTSYSAANNPEIEFNSRYKEKHNICV